MFATTKEDQADVETRQRITPTTTTTTKRSAEERNAEQRRREMSKSKAERC